MKLAFTGITAATSAGHTSLAMNPPFRTWNRNVRTCLLEPLQVVYRIRSRAAFAKNATGGRCAAPPYRSRLLHARIGSNTNAEMPHPPASR